ncbi:MAG: methicillin resistance protein [Patescibacteria group bacterium]|nr:MAG: methicillin resistance protein [Patescibacteria group bacterium]
MKITEIKDKNNWERFILSTEWTPFFQSWAFGNSQKSKNTKIYRLAVTENKKIIMACQIFEITAKRGRFFHLRHGPVFNDFSHKAFKLLLKHLVQLAETRDVWWIRMSPLISKEQGKTILKKYNLINSPTANQDAENCIVIDLKDSLETIFSRFKKNTRNLIRKAEKLGITIVESTSITDYHLFDDIYHKTAVRQNFVPHKNICSEFKTLVQKNQIKLFLGYYQQTLLSAALIVFYGKQAVYHHSGSIPTKLPVNYLLQWKVIQTAKNLGFRYYNLWGVSPRNKPNHPWSGLSFFKRSFGGTEIEFCHSLDLVLKAQYWLSYLYQKFWLWKKGYL